MTNDCKTCPVSTGTHKPAEALHQIAEPAAPVGKPIEDAIDALVMAAFTEGGCSEHRMSEARIQTELRKKELRTLLSTPQPCSRSHPHEEMTPMCELRTEIARLTNALARAEAQLAAAPQAVQAAVPLFWVRLLRDGLYEGPVHNNSVGGKLLRDEKPGEWHPLYLHAAPAHPAEGVPAHVHSALTDARAVLLSINRGDSHRVKVGDDVCYWQRDEWVQWAINEVLPMVNAAIAATHPTQQGLDAQGCDMFWVADDPDGQHDTLHDAVVRAFEDGGIDADGCVEIQCAKSIPNIVVLITGTEPFAFKVIPDSELAAQAKQGGA